LRWVLLLLVDDTFLIRAKETDMTALIQGVRADQHGAKASVWEEDIQRIFTVAVLIVAV